MAAASALADPFQILMAHPQRLALLRLLAQPAHWVHPLHQQQLLGLQDLPQLPDWGDHNGHGHGHGDSDNDSNNTAGRNDDASNASRIWQRQTHAALLARLQLPLALDWREDAMALALLDAPQWRQLQLAAGAALAAPRLRRVIARDQVLALHSALGAKVLLRACQGAAQPHPQPAARSGTHSDLQMQTQQTYSASALNALLALPLSALAPACWALGEALLARALAAVSPALARYLQLRLPPPAAAPAAQTASASTADPLASLVPPIVHAFTPAQALRRSLAALTAAVEPEPPQRRALT